MSPKMENATLATLGPEFTNSWMAASQWIGERKIEIVCFKTITEVFESIVRRKAQYGVVPMRNNSRDPLKNPPDVEETQRALKKWEGQIEILSQLDLPIHHCLATLPATNEDEIQRIISRQEALDQCQAYLAAHFPQAKQDGTYDSTAGALAYIKTTQESNLAGIGPERAALHHDLKILARNIEDRENNATTFVVLTLKSV